MWSKKQSKCSVDIFLTILLRLFHYISPSSITFIKDIYRRYFLRNIQRDIFNLPLDILNIPEISLADYKERTDNYTKYLKVKRSKRGSVKYLAIIFSHGRQVVRKISHRRKSVWKFSHWESVLRKFSHWEMSVRSQCENFRIRKCQCENSSSALRNRLQMDLTSSFQLQITHHLKRWTPNFPSFEMIYSM